MELKSKWDFSQASECRRGLMCGMGYSSEEQDRPRIAVVNSWNEYNPGHVHLKQIAERVKAGIRDAGGLPLEVMTTAICDGMVEKDPKYIEVPSRNSIADQVELTVEGNFFDGMVLLSTCDSIVPGHLMAAARINIPAIMVTGGYMPHGICRGKEVIHIHAQDKVGSMEAGRIDPDEYNDLIEHSWGTCGACTSMTTANSMCMVAEALGMSLPGNSTVAATSSELYKIAYQAGRRIMGLVEEGVTARKIITPKSVRNAIKMDMAVAGSSNLILHIPAIAYEAGYDEPWWKYFDEASNDIPLLAHLVPSGPRYSVHDLCLAGGMPALLKELLPKLDGDCLTVTGKTLAENVGNARNYNRDVIHSLDNPVMKMPGLGVLYGNLAPEGCIVKIAAVPQNLMTFKGPARVFDTLDDALDALKANQIKVGDACVLRFLGLKGRFGTTAFTFQEMLKGRKELFESCAVITDGRFSGGSSGLSVGYVSPEAALMGPLGLVRDGDEITIDIPDRRIDVAADLESRKKDFKWEFDGSKYSRYLNLFVRNVGSMAHGGIWE
ncbi:MAG TPA: dihydroxy-acid dehydratase [Candidatus Cryptobacteroides intestinipullorum]|nr:dihydroxy-acid dehydratase [Candidatus Cryptobacteroides intestinipullorum]